MITKTVQPYEFLVRCDENTGAYKGAYHKTITTVIDDQTGEVYAVLEGDPQPISFDMLVELLSQVKATADIAAKGLA